MAGDSLHALRRHPGGYGDVSVAITALGLAPSRRWSGGMFEPGYCIAMPRRVTAVGSQVGAGRQVLETRPRLRRFWFLLALSKGPPAAAPHLTRAHIMSEHTFIFYTRLPAKRVHTLFVTPTVMCMAPGAIAWRVLLSRTGLGWLFQLSSVRRLRRWRDECFSGARAEYGGYSGCSSPSLGAALRQ